MTGVSGSYRNEAARIDPIATFDDPDNPHRSPRGRWPVLLICFFASGTAGLVYQVAWTRQFALVFGSTELAVTAVLAAYLGGLGLGAGCAARFSPRVSRPVLIYALLEVAIAVSALAVPWAMRTAEMVYLRFFGMQEVLPQAGETATTLFHLVTAFAILSIPTACMGATLPILTRFGVRRKSEIGSATGLLYAVNTAGAVLGAPLSAFILLPEIGLRSTTLVAVGLNLLAGGVALIISRNTDLSTDPTTDRGSSDRPRKHLGNRDRVLLVLVFVSGAVSLVYEVFWTRLLGHLLGGSLYAFATMLASFLAGIALGSALAAGLARSRDRGIAGFAWAQAGIAGCTAASYAFVVRSASGPSLGWSFGTGPALDALLAAVALLPAALCIGATFPFAVRSLADHAHDAAPASARVFGWSTLGSIGGSIAGGFFLLPILGFAGTLESAMIANLVLALAAALFLGRRRSRLALVAAIALIILVLVPPSTPWSVLRRGSLQTGAVDGRIEHFGVGRNATVLLSESLGLWTLSSNGLPEGSIEPPGTPTGRYQVTRWLGSLASIVRPQTRTMMLIGLGAGEALEAISPSVETIDVVELEPEVVLANRSIADRRRFDPLSDPRVNLVINDARAALQLSSRQFDAIVSQPSHPWTAGSANLYTREFFDLVKQRLQPDGVFVQWIGLAFVDHELLRSILATLNDVFGEVVAYRPPTGAALLFVASDRPIDRFSSPEGLAAVSEIHDLGVSSPEDIAAALVLDAEGSRLLGSKGTLIRDDHNPLEARSSQLFGHALGRDLAESTLGPYDPLVGAAAPSLDRAAIVRRLLEIHHNARAARLAETTTDPTQRQVVLAALASASGRAELANQLVSDAVSRDPTTAECRGLAIRLKRPRLVRGESPDSRLMPLSSTEEAIVEGWRHGEDGRWSEIEILDPELAKITPSAPLFHEASRLRIAWRLASGIRGHALESIRIADAMLERGRTPTDLLLRARASVIAGDPHSTLASLTALARLVARHPTRGVWAQSSLAVLEQLPDQPSISAWRSSVESLLGPTED